MGAQESDAGLVLLGTSSLHIATWFPAQSWLFDMEPRFVAGGGLLAVSSAEGAVGQDTDWSFDYGPALVRRADSGWLFRADLRHHITAKYQLVKVPGHHVSMSLGIGRAFGGEEEPVIVDACPDGAQLTVRLTDPEGLPVPNAEIEHNGTLAGATDADGQLTLTGLPKGVPLGAFHVEPPLVHPVDVLDWSDPTVVTECASQQAQTLDWLPGTIRVVVRSADGPVPEATVSFRGDTFRDDEAVGEDGQEMFVLEPGTWTLLVSAEGYGIERRELEILPDERSLVVIDISLEEAVVETTTEELVILEAVQFDFDKDEPKPESDPLLTEVANNLLKFTEIAKVEVQGHTDNVGEDAYNSGLSQRRVDAVMARLVDLGVPSKRLTAVGYGEGCPIASNGTDAGRAENRRVQFIVLDPRPEGGIPCHDGQPARRATPTTIERTTTESPAE